MSDATEWLACIGLEQYAEAFSENDIGFDLLTSLDHEVLQAIGVKSAGHRQLTVMFCDLADSTALSGRLDAEAYRDLILAYQEICTRCVERYEEPAVASWVKVKSQKREQRDQVAAHFSDHVTSGMVK